MNVLTPAAIANARRKYDQHCRRAAAAEHDHVRHEHNRCANKHGRLIYAAEEEVPYPISESEDVLYRMSNLFRLPDDGKPVGAMRVKIAPSIHRFKIIRETTFGVIPVSPSLMSLPFPVLK